MSFKEIYIKDSITGNLINIINLEKKDYENFLKLINELHIAYKIAVERHEIICPECGKRFIEGKYAPYCSEYCAHYLG